jgi:arylsulfatase A-like enzyme
MSDDRENIVFVTIDSLRADHCGYLECEYDLTPTLDSLASDGIVFENAIAPGPRTPSSMPEVFTGEIFGPGDSVEAWDLPIRKERISRHLAQYRTIAEELNDLGYSTGAVTANPWTQYLPKMSYKRGFEEFSGLNGTDVFGDGRVSPGFRILDRTLQITGMDDHLNWRWMKDWFVQWPRVYDIIEDTLRATHEPYFVWIFLLDTHEPYLAPKEYRDENSALGMYYAAYKNQQANGHSPEFSPEEIRRLRRAYRDATRSFDRFLKRLLSDVPNDPAVVVHSDHGEAFGEHGTYGHEQVLYQENIHVPLVIGNTSVQKRIKAPVSLRTLPNVFKSLAEPGSDFEPENHTEPFVLSTTEDGTLRALCSREWKYIQNQRSEIDTAELYNLFDDPAEKHDLSGEFPKMEEEFDSLLRAKTSHVQKREAISNAVKQVPKT